MHALIKELATRRVEHRCGDIFQRVLASGGGNGRSTSSAAIISFVLQEEISFRTCHHPCRQGVALAGTRQLRSQGPVSIHAHCTEGIIRFEGREGASRDGN